MTHNALAGVDEAGLGPLLGPLAVAGASMSGPAGVDPWTALTEVVTRHESPKDHRRVRVADSKVVKQGPKGMARLETTVLAFHGAMRTLDGATEVIPHSVGALLEQLGVDLPRIQTCPWYQELDLPLPLHLGRDTLELLANRVANELTKADIHVHRMALQLVEVTEWNGLIRKTGNKGHAHFEAYVGVLRRLLDELPNGAHLVADRCGGRTRYRDTLRRHFPNRLVEVVSEKASGSSYRLRSDSGEGATSILLTFATGAENRAFPTALASCVAKYGRELLMSRVNAWFAGRVPGLKPTAGYTVDGRRFLKDIEPHRAELSIDLDQLVRIR